MSIFSAGEATKNTRSSIPLIFALCQASVIAFSTISTPISSSQSPCLRREIPILPAPQYRSNTLPSIFPAILIAVEKRSWAPRVLVWKKEEGQILNIASHSPSF
jgi:hypothetical protein